MKIAVCIKQTPLRDSVLVLSPDRLSIEPAGLEYEFNEPDAYALEAALALRDQHGGEVIAVSVGPERVSTSLREALAKGADRAIHVRSDEASEPATVSAALAAALTSEQPDLILTGLQSDDTGSGQTGVILAERLHLPHVTIVAAIEVNSGTLRVKRELEDGWYQQIDLPMPALLTVQSGIHQLRYATLLGIRKARTKEIRVVDAPAETPESGIALTGLSTPSSQRQTVMLEGPDAAEQLAQRLQNEARVL